MCQFGRILFVKRYNLPALPLFIICLLLFCSGNWSVWAIHSHHRNPYQILGISPYASPKEVKQRYYQLCLQYHPDKQPSHVSLKQRKRCEQMFKDIQWAYAAIGANRGPNEATSTSPFSESFRSYMNRKYHHPEEEGAGGAQWQPQSPFESSFSRSASFFDVWNRPVNDPYVRLFSFTGPSFSRKRYPSSPETPNPLASLWNPQARYLFVQRVAVPLSDLYAGCPHYAFPTPNMSLVSRIVAAFRGGMGQALLYQSMLYAIPLLRFSKILSIGFCCYMFLQSLPPIEPPSPEPHVLFANLLPGYKGQTKFIFHEAQTRLPNVEIQFILEEASHPLYRRVGNDLHVIHRISARQARLGGTIHIPSLLPEEDRRRGKPDAAVPRPARIAIRIPPATESGRVIRITGQGWPIRKPGSSSSAPLSFGDLVVTVDVESNQTSRLFSLRRHPK